MIEAGAEEIPDDLMLKAIEDQVIPRSEDGRIHQVSRRRSASPKFEFESMEVDHDLFDEIEAMVGEDVKEGSRYR
ncbi:hypothetical protein [Ruminococcus albus]|uniref:hypothetical protein n=1 Tax=Ruminococcus albus TaxID=1264 RepID=UPI000467BE6B|nr:hypothetical protein [Ruminococcus albus]